MNERLIDISVKFTEVYKANINEHKAIREMKCYSVLFPELLGQVNEEDTFVGNVGYGMGEYYIPIDVVPKKISQIGYCMHLASFEKLKNESVASMMTLSEESLRMQEMMKMYGMGMDASMFGTEVTLVLNVNHPLVQYVLNNKDGEHTALFCKQLYDLALLGNKPLNPEEMTAFVKRSNEIMMMLI